ALGHRGQAVRSGSAPAGTAPAGLTMASRTPGQSPCPGAYSTSAALPPTQLPSEVRTGPAVTAGRSQGLQPAKKSGPGPAHFADRLAARRKHSSLTRLRSFGDECLRRDVSPGRPGVLASRCPAPDFGPVAGFCEPVRLSGLGGASGRAERNVAAPYRRA